MQLNCVDLEFNRYKRQLEIWIVNKLMKIKVNQLNKSVI